MTLTMRAQESQAPFAEVRRFSASGVLSIGGFGLMKKGSSSESRTAFSSTVNTVPVTKRFGGGAGVQFAFGNRYAVTASALLRKLDFQTTTETYTGTDNTSTTADERKKETQTAYTNADLLDFPILIRRYSKGRDQAGRRWFAEAGMTMRRARNIRSFRQTVTSDDKTICCDESPLRPTNLLSHGVSAGAGLHMVDNFGVRLAPQVRYTQWITRTFDGATHRSRGPQIEILVSIGF